MAKFHSVHALISFSLLIVLTSCSSVPQQQDSQGKNYYTPGRDGIVMLSPRESSEGANDQPAMVKPDRLETLLADLYYPESRGGLSGWISDSERRTPLIQDAGLASLSLALSRALADAGSGEDVIVGVEQPRRDSTGTIIGYRLTAFRVFVADDRLNLLFGAVGENRDDGFRFATIHRKASTPDPRPGISEQWVQEYAGSRSVAANTGNRVLYSGPQQTVQQRRADWIELDLTSGEAAPPASSEQRPDEEVDDRTQKREEKLLRK